MNGRDILVFGGSLMLAGVLYGCSIGGGDEVVQQTKTTTTGKELEDLKSAYDKGLLTEREYNQQRNKILSGK